MLRRIIAYAAIFASFFPSIAQVQKSASPPLNGESLIENCRTKIETGQHPDEGVLAVQKSAHCIGYLEATLDSLTARDIETKGKLKPIACIPEDVTLGQVSKIVIKYGDTHPEDLHFPGVLFVREALRHAYPCE